MKRFLIVLFSVIIPVFAFSQEVERPITLQVPIDQVNNVLLLGKGDVELSCFRNFCQITTYNKFTAQNMKSMGIAKDMVVTDTDEEATTNTDISKNTDITKDELGSSSDSELIKHPASTSKGFIATISTNHAFDALSFGREQIELSCFGESCQFTTDNESIIKSLVYKGMAKSYAEDVRIPLSANPNDDNFTSQWGLYSGYYTDDFGWKEGWQQVMQYVSGIRNQYQIAIIDSGYQPHVDHYSQVACYKGTMLSTQNCGDVLGHGTHVQGIANALTNNSLGIAGVSGGKSGVISLNAKYNDNPYDDSLSHLYIRNALIKITEIAGGSPHPISVANMSFGSIENYDSYIYSYIGSLRVLGIVAVAAVGNDSLNIGINGQRHYPASYAQNNIVGVMSLGSSSTKASYSNYGGKTDIGAPGSSILSFGLSGYDYVYKQGTSMAAPYITGAIAAAKQIGPNVTGPQIVQLLYSTATRQSGLASYVRNGKVIHVGRFWKAVKACQGNDNAAGCAVPNTFPQRYDLNALPNPDPDAKPGNWFPPRNISYLIDANYNTNNQKKVTIYWNPQPDVVDAYEIYFQLPVSVSDPCTCSGGASGRIQTVSSNTGQYTVYVPASEVNSLKIRSVQHNTHIGTNATVYSNYVTVVK